MATCYGRVGTTKWTQEWYETAGNGGKERARELRKLGYQARTVGMGSQVTNVGRVKMSLVDIRHPDGSPPPWPEQYSEL